MPNLFHLPVRQADHEQIDILASGRQVRIERIVSRGHSSGPDFWYDQDQDEWVCLLQGEACLAWEDGSMRRLVPGDWLFIPAHVRHRVESTSSEPPCIWLAVHGALNSASTR